MTSVSPLCSQPEANFHLYVGVRISFRDEFGLELCSVRLIDTMQRWSDILTRISTHPTVSRYSAALSAPGNGSL